MSLSVGNGYRLMAACAVSWHCLYSMMFKYSTGYW